MQQGSNARKRNQAKFSLLKRQANSVRANNVAESNGSRPWRRDFIEPEDEQSSDDGKSTLKPSIWIRSQHAEKILVPKNDARGDVRSGGGGDEDNMTKGILSLRSGDEEVITKNPLTLSQECREWNESYSIIKPSPGKLAKFYALDRKYYSGLTSILSHIRFLLTIDLEKYDVYYYARTENQMTLLAELFKIRIIQACRDDEVLDDKPKVLICQLNLSDTTTLLDTQRTIVSRIKPQMACLQFSLPLVEKIIPYYSGTIVTEPFRKAKSNLTRLIVHDTEKFSEYNSLDYNCSLSYYNSYLRNDCSWTWNEYKGNYDTCYALYILAAYNKRFQSDLTLESLLAKSQ